MSKFRIIRCLLISLIASIKRITKPHYIIAPFSFLLFYFLLFQTNSYAAEEDKYEYLKELYEKRRYYDVISESMRFISIKENYETNKEAVDLMAASAYFARDFTLLKFMEVEPLPNETLLSNPKFSLLISIAQKEFINAELQYLELNPEIKTLPYSNKIHDADEAARRAGYFPGLGMFYLEEYPLGLGMIFLEAILGYLTYYFFTNENYGASLISLFGFYRYYYGTIESTREKANNLNHSTRFNFFNDLSLSIEATLLKF